MIYQGVSLHGLTPFFVLGGRLYIFLQLGSESAWSRAVTAFRVWDADPL